MLTDIPYARYDLYVYNLGVTGVGQQTTLGGTSYYTTSPDGAGAGYVDGDRTTVLIYELAISMDLANPTLNANLVRFTGLSGSSQNFFTASMDGGLLPSNVVRAIQVVNTTPVPEPSTYAMMALGMGVLDLVTRRK